MRVAVLAGGRSSEHDVSLASGAAVRDALERAGHETLFVKPARLGSSVGISKVAAPDELPGALAASFEHDPVALVERMSAGMEVECSVIGNGELTVSQPGEIVLHADWYDYEAKYTPGGMELVMPPQLSPEAIERVRDLAAEVYRSVGCAGFARVDFFVEDGERVLVNELNTIPGFTETSGFPKMFEASGLPFPQLVDRILQLALERHREESAYRY